MIATLGGLFDGWALYLDMGKPVFYYDFGSVAHYEIDPPDALAPAPHTIIFDFQYDGRCLLKGSFCSVLWLEWGSATVNMKTGAPGSRPFSGYSVS